MKISQIYYIYNNFFQNYHNFKLKNKICSYYWIHYLLTIQQCIIISIDFFDPKLYIINNYDDH
jgi:hypothetical protein